MSSNEMKISKFELIPNEILLEIFQHLSPYDLFQAFYFLNKRYDTLLLSLPLRIDLMNIFKKNFDYYNYFVFSLIPYRIISFRCEDIFDRLIYQIRLSEFISLKYLTIYNLNVQNFQLIISQLDKLQQLIYFNLQIRPNTTIGNKIIFNGQIPLVQKCILNLNKQISFQNNNFYLNLRYLTISQCAIEDLLSFFYIYTPQLQHLTVTLIEGNIPYEKIYNTHRLKSLIINTRTVSFRHLTNSVLTLFPYLQRLTINAAGIDYTDGKQWATFLLSNFSHLIKFQLYIIFSQHELPTPDARTQLLKTFEISYFYSHNWYFGFIYHSSSANIELFSLPIINNKIDFNLYNTHIETTKNDENIFKNITELSLIIKNSTENSILSNFIFPNIKNLKLISEFQEYEPFPKMLFVNISHLMKFSQLKSIEFIGMHFPSTILILLDYTPNLQSLTISLNNLIKMTKSLNDNNVCHRLTTLIKNLTITSIDNVKNLQIFERLPIVFNQLESLSLFIQNPSDLYILMTLILSKMSQILKIMNVYIETQCHRNIIDPIMLWLIDYMHRRDLDLVDVKLTDNQLSFCF